MSSLFFVVTVYASSVSFATLLRAVESTAACPPQRKGILLAGNNVSGVQKMTRVLRNTGYVLDKVPRPSATVSVINNHELWDYGLDYHKLYVSGALPLSREQEQWADHVVDAYNEGAMIDLADELTSQSLVKE